MASNMKVQRPGPGPFTRDELIWDERSTAHIPAERFFDFVLGEQLRLWPRTIFLIQKSWTCASGPSRPISDDTIYSERRSYHCAYGPEDDDMRNPDYESTETSIDKLGCECRFEYRKLHRYPNVVCISFEQKNHVDNRHFGWPVPVHSIPDPGFLDHHRFARQISDELKLWVYTRLQANVTPKQIMAEYRENKLSEMQREGKNYRFSRDDFMQSSHIRNIASAVSKGTWKLLPKNMTPARRSYFQIDCPTSTMFGTIPPQIQLCRQSMLEETTVHEQAAQLGTRKGEYASEVPPVQQVSVATAGPTDVSRLRVSAIEDGSRHYYSESMLSDMKTALETSHLNLYRKRLHSFLE